MVIDNYVGRCGSWMNNINNINNRIQISVPIIQVLSNILRILYSQAAVYNEY